MIQVKGTIRRYPIRSTGSDLAVKPRIMDYIITDDGQEALEVKDGRCRKTISLEELKQQIADARNHS